MADVKRTEGADSGAEPAPRRSGALLKLGLLVLLIVAAVLAVRLTPVGDWLSREGIGRGIELVRGSPWAPALFVLIYGAAMALALPGTALTLAGGALFGFGWGVVFNTVGANLGANAAFGVARWLGRDGVEKLAGDRLEKLDRATEEHGFKGLLTLRLIPVVPFNALNFGAGLTAMPWGSYALATLIGIFPGTVVYTLFADALLQGSTEASRDAFIRMTIAGILLVFLSFLPTIMKKLNVKIGSGTSALLLVVAGLAGGCGGDSAGDGNGSTDAPATAGVARAPAAETAVSSQVQGIPDHRAFTTILQRHVEGSRVDYGGLQDDRTALDAYLASLATTSESDLASASADARLAFWINAYNACMLKLVVDHYPLVERPGLFQRIINFAADRPENSVWQIEDVFTREHCDVAGDARSQDEIEHEIIRPTFDEPRIHFAVNCAALSCPVLADVAYTGAALDSQLDRQVRTFMENPSHYLLEDGDPAVLTVNQVLEWYGGDFGGPEGVKEFFAAYEGESDAEVLRRPGTRVEHVEYDWTLNDTGL